MNFFHRARAKHIQLGRRGEKLAARFLEKRSAVILARNWRFSTAHDGIGELDMVVLDGRTVVFVEVKSRRKLDNYRPGTNLSPSQKKRIWRGAHAYCRKHSAVKELDKRFDLIEVIHNNWKIIDIIWTEGYMPFGEMHI